MSAPYIIGIDPGIEGAVAYMTPDGELADILDIPCLDDGIKGRRTINAPLLASIFWQRTPAHAYVELITSRPTDGRVAAFAFGRCRGVLEGTLAAVGVPATMLAVPSWRKAVGLPAGATKDQARGEACRRWPGKAELFARKRDDGRAEAALIAVAGILRGHR